MPRTGGNFEGKRHAKCGMPLFLISIAIFSFIGRWTLDALVNYNIPQLCMPAVPRRAVRTVTTKRIISVQVFFFIGSTF